MDDPHVSLAESHSFATLSKAVFKKERVVMT